MPLLKGVYPERVSWKKRGASQDLKNKTKTTTTKRLELKKESKKHEDWLEFGKIWIEWVTPLRTIFFPSLSIVSLRICVTIRPKY